MGTHAALPAGGRAGRLPSATAAAPPRRPPPAFLLSHPLLLWILSVCLLRSRLLHTEGRKAAAGLLNGRPHAACRHPK